mgnify:CR=1 FL=1
MLVNWSVVVFFAHELPFPFGYRRGYRERNRPKSKGRVLMFSDNFSLFISRCIHRFFLLFAAFPALGPPLSRSARSENHGKLMFRRGDTCRCLRDNFRRRHSGICSPPRLHDPPDHPGCKNYSFWDGNAGPPSFAPPADCNRPVCFPDSFFPKIHRFREWEADF